MAAAAEEAREEVEGVMVLLPATLLALLDAFMAILVVDFARLRVGKGFVGFGNFDEFLLGSLVISCRIVRDL